MTYPPAERMGESAIAVARGLHQSNSNIWRNLCLMCVRMDYGVPAKHPTALHAWNAATRKHHVSSGAQVPRGVPVFWGVGAGHVAIAVGNGMCWSTDFWRSGCVDMARIDLISERWGKPLLGWTEDLNSHTVYKAPPKAPPLEVSLANTQTAARLDPGRPQGGQTVGAYHSVLRTERMMAVEGRLSWAYVDGSFGTKTREAYAAYQRSLGYSGIDANGVPGGTSLGALCKRHNMKLIP